MMGSGGGGGYIPPSSETLQQKIEREREREQSRLEADVSKFLQDLLTRFNNRDVDAMRQKLDALQKTLGDANEVEQFLFGGSVAKHTFVDGLSDVDALVILDRAELQGKSPGVVLNAFYNQLNESLPRDTVASITKGNMAVLVTYRDGTEIQLLPALRSGATISITDATGKAWKETRPQVVCRQLTRTNEKLNYALVPVIKLLKSINARLPSQQQLTGYHTETLALDAAQNYKGPMTPKTVLLHALDHASSRVLRPIQDATGQSRVADSYLGKANSVQRRNISQALAGVKRRLDAATTVGQWKALFED
jgi:hypothetical protein